MNNLIKKKFYTPLMPKLHLVINDIANQNKKLYYYISTQKFIIENLEDGKYYITTSGWPSKLNPNTGCVSIAELKWKK